MIIIKYICVIGIQRQGNEQKTSDEEQWQHEASSDGTSLWGEGLVEERALKSQNYGLECEYILQTK